MKRLVLAVVVAGCVTEPEVAGVSVDEQAIIGGTRSIGVTATVMLAGYPPDRSLLHTCTAVVVSPTVLLTAAHCIDAPNHPNYRFGVFTGDDATPYPNLAALEPQLKPVATVHPHPQYSTQVPFFADIGVVVMAAPLPNAPIPMQREPLTASVIGKPAQIVGYGQTVYDQYNSARHEAMTTVAALDTDTITVGDSQRRACLGDSGGPAIVDGKVVGIDSYGPVGCGGPAHYRRVDYFLPFIEPYMPAPMPEDPDMDPVDPMDDVEMESGGCAAGGGAGMWLALAALGVRRRRR